MEYKNYFQKKFSNSRSNIASKSPTNKTQSNSLLKKSNSKVHKPKKGSIQNTDIEKKSISKLTTINNSNQGINQPSIIRDLQLQLSTLNSTLKHLPIGSVKQITCYYQIIKQFIKQMIDSPFNNILKIIHSIYIFPLPTLITKNDFTIKKYEQQPNNQLQISDILNKSKSRLNQYRKNSACKSSKLLTTTNSNTNSSTIIQLSKLLKDNSSKKLQKSGFKLNMNRIKQTKENVKDYFDQFYDNIQEFSQSWREQALKQKR